jgi:hypothetical protein
MTLTIRKIQLWLRAHQNRLQHGEPVISISSLADKAGISRQTLYAILNGERTEFGQIAQIRLSRVINQISSEPSYQHSKIAKIDLSGSSPRIKFGV